MENDTLKGITLQLIHISAQLDVLTSYVTKNASQSEKDEIVNNITEKVNEKIRILDTLNNMIISE